MKLPVTAEVRIDLARIRENCREVRRVEGVPVLAVVKADAYGLGAKRVSRAIAELVDGFCVLRLEEAVAADLRETGRPTLVLGPPGDQTSQQYIDARARPTVTTAAQAAALREAKPVVCIDTGMQRFSCPPEEIDEVIRAGDCHEAFTHATKFDQVEQLLRYVGGRGLRLHAAGSALLSEPRAMLDAIRPGLALYRGAVRVIASLVETHDTRGPAGYSGFVVPRHGVIPCGYSHGLQPGVCRINGQARRVIEVGMQSAFVEIGHGDRVGDEVVLLGDELGEAELASSWNVSPQEVLVRLCRAGPRKYLDNV